MKARDPLIDPQPPAFGDDRLNSVRAGFIQGDQLALAHEALRVVPIEREDLLFGRHRDGEPLIEVRRDSQILAKSLAELAFIQSRARERWKLSPDGKRSEPRRLSVDRVGVRLLGA
jgi:hypothetical protein